MSKTDEPLKVYLDHLIPRQNLRYITKNNEMSSFSVENKERKSEQIDNDNKVRYSDILNNAWFNNIRKPDFQRETIAWTPELCVDFLDTVIHGYVIPSIILWASPENIYTYVLDGAHRLSVIRAWMTDDWGDSSIAEKYYERRDPKPIVDAANITRNLVKNKIGSFVEYQAAFELLMDLNDQEVTAKQKMGNKYFYGRIYSDMMIRNKTLHIQWESGNYQSAEQSFLRINRKGQNLDSWEANFIEYRNSSYARSIMSIVSGGSDGHYWPQLPDNTDEALKQRVKTFAEKANKINRDLFVPPLELPIRNINVPLMIAPPYFQKHKYLLEFIPLVLFGQRDETDEDHLKRLKEDADAPIEEIVRNGDKILSTLCEKIEHFVTSTHNSTSLSIVPLFYWYNQKAEYVRGLFYGFVYWLLAGTQEEIKARKQIFSANRDRFEYIFFNFKPELSDIGQKNGAGLRTVPSLANFCNDLLSLLHEHQKLVVESDEMRDKVMAILLNYATLRIRKQEPKSSRGFSISDRSQINIRKLFENSVTCDICGGIVNLEKGLQYDHTLDYAISKVTDPNNGAPTHPFCNNHKRIILSYRQGKETIQFPQFRVDDEQRPSKQTVKRQKEIANGQLTLFDDSFWNADFPT